MKKLIDAARGKTSADLVIKNAKLVNVLSEEIYSADIAITDGIIVGLGSGYNGKKEIDVKGSYVTPSFIDGHVHLESSMMLPSEFAKAVLPCGTTTVITDPHEIANVLGSEGIKFMLNATQNIGLDVYFMLPSCVPATPFETSGFSLSADDLAPLIDHPRVLGIAEMMNYVGVINGDESILAKVSLAKTHNKCLDGHAPVLSGKDLCAYVTAGIKSDHECTCVEEALEKMRLGLNIMIREGSAAKDLQALIPLLKQNYTRKCMFVTDDRHPTELNEHINGMVKTCVQAGINPIKAIQAASLNTAEYFGLKNIGAVAPGYKADMLVFPDLENFVPQYVIKDGRIIVKDGALKLSDAVSAEISLKNTIHVNPLSAADLQIKAQTNKIKVIDVIEHQLITGKQIVAANIVDGNVIGDLSADILKICVIERHHNSGNIGKAFVKGFGLKSGAIASTVAHDSHNMIVIGTNDEDMCLAANELIKCGGGKIAVNNGKILAVLPLPIAGLMSDKSFAEVLKQCLALKKSVQELGSTLHDPFMTMAFLSLSVIPELKITDKGLFSTETFDFTDIFVQ